MENNGLIIIPYPVNSQLDTGNFTFNQWENRKIADILNQEIKQILRKI